MFFSIFTVFFYLDFLLSTSKWEYDKQYPQEDEFSNVLFEDQYKWLEQRLDTKNSAPEDDNVKNKTENNIWLYKVEQNLYRAAVLLGVPGSYCFNDSIGREMDFYLLRYTADLTLKYQIKNARALKEQYLSRNSHNEILFDDALRAEKMVLNTKYEIASHLRLVEKALTMLDSCNEEILMAKESQYRKLENQYSKWEKAIAKFLEQPVKSMLISPRRYGFPKPCRLKKENYSDSGSGIKSSSIELVHFPGEITPSSQEESSESLSTESTYFPGEITSSSQEENGELLSI